MSIMDNSSSVKLPLNFDEQVQDCNTDNDIPCECSDEECLQQKIKECRCSGLEEIIKEREQAIKKKYQNILNKEVEMLKTKFEMIMENEQVRTFALLHSAQHEKHEKIRHLRTKLECKNISGLMYVLCTERRRAHLEKEKLIEAYSACIEELAVELQNKTECIHNMMLLFKSSKTIDDEWRLKTKKLIAEFQKFLQHYFGSAPEVSQFFFDNNKQLKINSMKEEEKEEDINSCNNIECACEIECISHEIECEWWEKLDGDKKPFVVYGDMMGLKPAQRKDITNKLKDKDGGECGEFDFGNKFIEKSCRNLKLILDKCIARLKGVGICIPSIEEADRRSSCEVHVPTTVTMQNTLRSLIKGVSRRKSEPAAIIGAKDSLEIASSNLHKHKQGEYDGELEGEDLRSLKFSVLRKRNSVESLIDEIKQMRSDLLITNSDADEPTNTTDISPDDLDDQINKTSKLGIVRDSIQIVNKQALSLEGDHLQQRDCPDTFCKSEKADNFVNKLPSYMQKFYYYGRSFDNYEPCTKEQLEELLNKAAPIEPAPSGSSSLLGDGAVPVDVAVQTSRSNTSVVCTCDENQQRNWDAADQLFKDMKLKLDKIPESKFFDDRIDFDRFKCVGFDESGEDLQTSKENLRRPSPADSQDFAKERLEGVRKVLNEHPSLNELFLATTIPINETQLTVYI